MLRQRRVGQTPMLLRSGFQQLRPLLFVVRHLSEMPKGVRRVLSRLVNRPFPFQRASLVRHVQRCPAISLSINGSSLRRSVRVRTDSRRLLRGPPHNEPCTVLRRTGATRPEVVLQGGSSAGNVVFGMDIRSSKASLGTPMIQIIYYSLYCVRLLSSESNVNLGIFQGMPKNLDG